MGAAQHSNNHQTKLRQTQKGTTYVGGISLKYIDELISSKYKSYELSPVATMTDLVRDVIKPATKDKQESYLQKLAREQPSKVKSTADHFVSYVWSYYLDELLAALKYTLLDKTQDDDVYIWLDAFCVNQHMKSTATPQQLQQTFGESLKVIGSVVMVLVNWRQPEYAQRIWCVFESYMAKKNNTRIILAMSKKEEQSLVEAMAGNQIFDTFLISLFGTIDVESAKAKEPADQQAILQLIREFGVADVNSVILDNLKQWLVQGGEIALKSVDKNSDPAGCIYTARCFLHRTLGEFDIALEYAEKVLPIGIKLYGPQHESVAIGYANQAMCLMDLGRLDEAAAANEKSFTICNNKFGMNHPMTITAYAGKASMLESRGKLKEALLVRDEVLQKCTFIYGPQDDRTLIAMNLKANCWRQLKQFDEALELFNQIIEITKLNIVRFGLSENQPAFADRLTSKAFCLIDMKRPQEALALCEQAMGIFRKTMGGNSPAVGATLMIKGRCLDDLGKGEQAIQIFDEALAIYTKITKAKEHTVVADALYRKSLCLKHLGRQKEGKELGKQAIEIYERKLGKDHPTTKEMRGVWAG
jgi:tetratricopeptide (TPR) repeat protein